MMFRLIGHSIDKSARIHPILLWKCKKIVVEEKVNIGPLTVFRELNRLHLGKGAKVGQLNWISASAMLSKLGAPSELVMQQETVITNRHYLDVSGGVRIESFSAITGVRSTLMTHGVSYATNQQSWKEIVIGHHNLIGSNSIIVPGVKTPPHSIYGMGSLIAGQSSDEYQLYLNSPSKVAKTLDMDNRYFKKSNG